MIGALIARLSGDEDRFGRTQIDRTRPSASSAWRSSSALTSAARPRCRSPACSSPPSATPIGPRIFNRYLSDLPNLGVVAASLAIVAIVYAPFALSNLPAHLSLEVAASLIALAFVPTLLGFLVFFALIDEIGPVRTTVVTYVNPAVALILGVVLLGEPFTLGLALGLPSRHRRLGARDPPARCDQRPNRRPPRPLSAP